MEIARFDFRSLVRRKKLPAQLRLELRIVLSVAKSPY
jgi:hypothetical protein